MEIRARITRLLLLTAKGKEKCFPVVSFYFPVMLDASNT